MWTYTDIVYDVHQKEIHDMATELSGSKAGTTHYLSFYRMAYKIIEERLDEETRVKYQAEARQWTEYEPPPQQQRRYVYTCHSIQQKVMTYHQFRSFEKHDQKVLCNFTKCMYHQFGVQVAILVGYCNGNGETTVTM